MTILLILIFISVLFIVAITVFQKDPLFQKTALKSYQYTKKQFFMTRSEHEFYDILLKAVGTEYYAFPQVHLSTILDNKVKGQNWKGSFSHINGKSVDFVLCDKEFISPKLAIELDDSSHNREDRQKRDIEVERILTEARLPLLRLESYDGYRVDQLKKIIDEVLEKKSISSDK